MKQLHSQDVGALIETVAVPDIFLGTEVPSSAIDRSAPRSESIITMLAGGKHTTCTHSLSSLDLPPAALASLPPAGNS